MSPRSSRRTVHHISELEQIEALVSPVRGLLLNTLASSGPCSVGDLARLVGRKPRALYYHLDALVACGLVREVGSRPTRRRQETLYDAIADTVMVDENIRDDPEWVDAHRRAVGATLRQAMRTYDAALTAAPKDEDGAPVEMRMQSVQAQLSSAGIKRVRQKIEELLTVMREERAKHDGEFHLMTITLAPIVDAVDLPDRDLGDA